MNHKSYEVRFGDGWPKTYVYPTATPTAVAEFVMTHVPGAEHEVWVRRNRPGSKWVLYRMVNGKAKRAKSLEVPNGPNNGE